MLYFFFLFFLFKISLQTSCLSQKNQTGLCMNNINNCLGSEITGNCTGQNLICCISDITYNQPNNIFISKQNFFKIFANTPRNNYLYPFICEALDLAKIGDEYKASAFIAILAGETNKFENLDQQLPSEYFKKFALNWRTNGTILISNGQSQKGDLSVLADGTFFNFTQLAHSFTTKLNDIVSRADMSDRILEVIGRKRMKRGHGIKCEIGNKVGYAVPLCLNGFRKPYCGCEGTQAQRSCPYGFDLTNKCRNSAIITCCVESLKNAMDLVFAIDSSSSIGIYEFNQTKEFIIKLLNNLEIGLEDTRVGVIRFNNDAKEFITFNNNSNLFESILDIPFNPGKTNTSGALKLANEKLFQENNGMRPMGSGIPKVLVLITDGESDSKNETLSEANRLKERGINIVTVGICNVCEEELFEIASYKQSFFQVNNYDEIFDILDGVSRSSNIQPAKASDSFEQKIYQDSYRYVSYNEMDSNQTFYISIENINGKASIAASFDDTMPKTQSDYINEIDEKMDQVDEISVIRPENATNLTIGIKCDNSSDCYFRLKITNETRYINVTTLNYTSDFTTLHDTTEKEFTLTTRITHVTSQLTTKISTFLTSLCQNLQEILIMDSSNMNQQANNNKWSITQQPTAHSNNVHSEPHAKRNWTIGLLGCLKDIKGIACASFLFPLYLCMTYSKAGQGVCDCIFGGLLPLRVKVRTERAIEGSICGDVCATCCCPCCALIQTAHEVEHTQPII
ncbi:unnamed protein product [Brachionus calyciflorus]|uniref:VWFA domain-containing protein n=1 Tax=Brachionus calyciflorus TaxID=104777 RepID=A0A814K916_9BILA|nr:unnamed protein product [Brachionus calyciflorus]